VCFIVVGTLGTGLEGFGRDVGNEPVDFICGCGALLNRESNTDWEAIEVEDKEEEVGDGDMEEERVVVEKDIVEEDDLP